MNENPRNADAARAGRFRALLDPWASQPMAVRCAHGTGVMLCAAGLAQFLCTVLSHGFGSFLLTRGIDPRTDLLWGRFYLFEGPEKAKLGFFLDVLIAGWLWWKGGMMMQKARRTALGLADRYPAPDEAPPLIHWRRLLFALPVFLLASFLVDQFVQDPWREGVSAVLISSLVFWAMSGTAKARS